MPDKKELDPDQVLRHSACCEMMYTHKAAGVASAIYDLNLSLINQFLIVEYLPTRQPIVVVLHRQLDQQ
jgi:hypothetical protein